MVPEFEFEKENEIIKRETKITIIIAIALLISILVYTVISFYLKVEINLEKNILEKIYFIMNFLTIFFIITLLAIKKRIYYSPKIIKKNDNLTQILQKWRSIDIVLLAVAETISIFGLLITLLGMPFKRTFHFFVGSALLILLLIPMDMKIRERLKNLTKTFE